MSSLVSLMVLAQAAADQVGRGRIQGGWGYVWTSYGITWAAFCLYALSLWVRRPKNPSVGPKE
ncbi:hypothetical protein [Hyalangium versicolor]|uniref:hypothetical protein n=1 Tax=Hyalangium versicolor TaxID=2861190 RepID=UPI001CCC875A|nr:hypothetical protein [Hyalangium versicolor]